MKRELEIEEIISYGYESNTFVVKSESGAILFDAGATVNDIDAVLEGSKVLAVFITHSHFDHILRLDDYSSRYNVPVYISKIGIERLFDAEKNLSTLFLDTPIIVQSRDDIVALEDGEKIEIGDITIRCISAKGHSDCSMVYVVNERYAVVGDVLFENGIGRYDFYDGDYGKLFSSIKMTKRLSVEKYYPGHGESFEK